MTLVAISATYGAGGSEVAPAVAERLGVPFVDRAIPFEVAERLAVPVDDVLAGGEEHPPSLLERILRGFIGGDAGAPVAVGPDTVLPEDFRRATEEVLRRQAAAGDGVLLGRASVVVLRDDPRVLRVRLDGPEAARAEQAARMGSLEREQALRTLRQTDAAHRDYAQRFYGVDIRDPRLYHVMLDSTALALDACAELIVSAARTYRAVGLSS